MLSHNQPVESLDAVRIPNFQRAVDAAIGPVAQASRQHLGRFWGLGLGFGDLGSLGDYYSSSYSYHYSYF